MVERPIIWVGSSRRDLRAFPRAVRRDIGLSLYAAQQGETDPSAKPLKGFGGGSVMEIVAEDRGGTWRAVYTVRFADAIYVLYAFQKKSKKGIATSNRDMNLTRQRMAEADGYTERAKTKIKYDHEDKKIIQFTKAAGRKKQRECFRRSRTASSGTGAIEGQADFADLPTDQTTWPQAGGSRKDSRHSAASRFGTDAQPRRRLFRRAPYGLPHRPGPRRGNHRKTHSQVPRRSVGGCVRVTRSNLAWNAAWHQSGPRLASNERTRTWRTRPYSLLDLVRRRLRFDLEHHAVAYSAYGRGAVEVAFGVEEQPVG